LRVFNTKYLHLLQVDMQGLSSSSTAVHSWRPRVTSTDCLKDVVIQLHIAKFHRFRETKPCTVARLTFIFIINIPACPYIPKRFILHAPNGKHQVKGRFTCYSRTVGFHPLAPEIWKWFLDFTKICVRLLCRIFCIPLTCF